MTDGGTFNLILGREFLERLLNDEALWADVGPFRFFFQLDDGTKPVVENLDEFREKRRNVQEWTWKRVEPSPETTGDKTNE